MAFNEILDKQGLDELIKNSNDAPVILFKHSTTCPISANAHREMTKVASPVGLVVVQHSRELSREVERRTGVRHESPQAFVLRNGEVAWHASHYDITQADVEQVMSDNA
ncbi:MAG: bacillithiol system redox-active protein YtxJ [Pyrinomonadaceae bacterium MAG19_C2-C3]|nr:bacillithiol system redox-active protein YtxJ [Pyrinomonadaceae bacterium MAG19_C2-C3]